MAWTLQPVLHSCMLLNVYPHDEVSGGTLPCVPHVYCDLGAMPLAAVASVCFSGKTCRRWLLTLHACVHCLLT
jgi:hypothetical protein